MTPEAKAATAVATLAGIALLVRAMRSPPSTSLDPNPPTPPNGWTHLLQSEVTPELTKKAIEFLGSDAPIGSMNEFELGGRRFGAFITRHIKNGQVVRAVELFRPLV